MTHRRSGLRPTPLLLSVVLLAALLLPAAPATLAASPPLTPEQVECERVKLRGLLYLSTARGQSPGPATLLVSPGAGESVGLLAVENQWGDFREGEPLDPGRVPEVHLGATLVPTASTLLLNPERPRLEQLALVRDDPSTTLRTDQPELPVLELAVHAAESSEPRTRLVVDTASLAGATRPGRPLRISGAALECGLPLTDEDRLVQAVLQRLVRPRFQFLFPFDMNTTNPFVAIYRAEAPDTFWIDVYEEVAILDPTPPPGGLEIFFPANRLRLTAARDAEGRLETGELELVRLQNPDLFVDLFFAPPILPGVEVWSEEEPPTVRLAFPEAFDSGPVTVDLAALLAGTTWNPPRSGEEPDA